MVSKLSYINTAAALEDASTFANKVQSSEKSGSSPSSVRHDHYHWGSGWGFYPQPAYYGGSGNSDRKNYSWVAVPATIVAFATMYCIGQNHAEWSQAKQGISKLEQKNLAVEAELSTAHPSLKNSVRTVYDKQMSILNQIRERAETDLLLKGVLVTSVLAAGVGGLATGGWFIPALEPLLVYGSGTSILSGLAMLYRAGFSSRDDAIHAEAEELKASVNRAAWALNESAGFSSFKS